MTTARVLNLTAREYHADPMTWGKPMLSAGTAKVLLGKSPKHAWQIHPRLGGTRREATPSMERGTLIHGLLLDTPDTYVVIDGFDDFRTNAAKAKRDEALAARKAPVLRKDYDEAKSACVHLCKNIRDLTGLDLGMDPDIRTEQVVVWQQEGADCRSMMDAIKGRYIYDFKTCQSAHPADCRRAIERYGYDIQDAAYTSGMKHLIGPEVVFIFVFMETEPPYAVTPVRLEQNMYRDARGKWSDACSTWARCLETGVWPSYTDRTVIVAGDPKPVFNRINPEDYSP